MGNSKLIHKTVNTFDHVLSCLLNLYCKSLWDLQLWGIMGHHHHTLLPSKNVLLTISLSPTNPSCTTSWRHKSASYFAPQNARQAANLQVITLCKSVDRSPYSFNDGTKYLWCQNRHVHLVEFFNKQDKKCSELNWTLLMIIFTSLQNCLPLLLVKCLIEAGARVTHLLQERNKMPLLTN